MSYVLHLECSRTGERLPAHRPQNLSPAGAPLLVRYDLEAVGRAVAPAVFAARPATLWRYRELLPARKPLTLGEGKTPILHLDRLGRALGLPQLHLMDEGRNPTGTFKDRGAAVGLARARELGINAVILPTAGNAGGAWAAYGATAGIRVHVVVPRGTPAANLLEARLYGAEVTRVEGTLAEAGERAAALAAEKGYFQVTTLKEPYRIEGKKTLGLELAEHFAWAGPDVVLCPTGGGVGLIGIWKAYAEMKALGWMRRCPRLTAVQPAGCAPIVRAFHEGREVSAAWPDPRTVAAGLRVPKALGVFLVLRALRETQGTAVAVPDRDILAALARLGREAGVAACPEGAATLAAAIRLRRQGWLRPADRVVLLNTGTTRKYPEAIAAAHRAGAAG